MQLDDGIDEVMVYQYRYWDEAAGERKVSKQYATLDTIRNGLGVPIFTSGKKVPTHLVANGVLRSEGDRRR